MLYERIVSFAQKIYANKLIMLPIFFMGILLFLCVLFSLMISTVFFIEMLEEHNVNVLVLYIVIFFLLIPMMMVSSKLMAIFECFINYIRTNVFRRTKLSEYEKARKQFSKDQGQHG